jgi:plasmid maintenance system antidote protein VapI
MTPLAEHLQAFGITQAQFAVAVGVDQATISKLCRGKLVPSLALAFRIEWETGGLCPASAWVTAASDGRAAA